MQIDLPKSGTKLTLVEIGDPSARPILMLHGSGGASSLGRVPTQLAKGFRVLVPSHPGYDGTIRPEGLNSPAQLASVYFELLEQLQLENTVVIGFSIGGWTAMELAIADRGRVGSLILVDPIGVQVPGHPITNVMALPAAEALKANFHDPAPFIAAAQAATKEQQAAQSANTAATAAYAAQGGLFDETLPQRLKEVSVPVLVILGESEQIVPVESGLAIVEAVTSPAELTRIYGAGHRPQLEQPAAVERVFAKFLTSNL